MKCENSDYDDCDCIVEIDNDDCIDNSDDCDNSDNSDDCSKDKKCKKNKKCKKDKHDCKKYNNKCDNKVMKKNKKKHSVTVCIKIENGKDCKK